MTNRKAIVKRETKETAINLEINLDGSGDWAVNTGIGMFDHLLSHLSRHGAFDINISASGDDQHHLVEDVAICLGKALTEALAEKRGIVRMASVLVPMDDTLVLVAVDLSGRGYAVLDLPFSNK